ncbi:MAG: prephenate dehydrogenase [Chloroflexi bacterium]|nr:prephenate dehydrogenase [Chloroflexota bacterium]
MRVAIIGGSGKMGRWFAGFLSQDGHEVVIAGRNEETLLKVKQQLGVQATTDLPAAVEGAKVVLLSVPIDSFETVVKELKPHLKPEQIVLDITSVKTLPVATMQKHLGDGSVLGTHPVFGPGAKGMRNQNVVLTPTNEKETALAEKVRRYLEERGAKVSVMTPGEHDEMIAIVLGLSHFIAIVTADTLLNFKRLREMAAVAGPTYKVLLTLAESVLTEDPELYAAIQMNLPRMPEIEELFLKSSKTWLDMVKNQDRQGFASRMNTLREKMAQNDPDFGKSYDAMYKLLEGR